MIILHLAATDYEKWYG